MIQRILAQRYELLENIGGGGMAEVYRAHDKLLDRPVAVKILHPQLANDAEFIEKFNREAKAAAKLAHANIVNIYDVGVDQGNNFIVMEYVGGDTLKNYIQKAGCLETEEALHIAMEIASALCAAHRSNLIHCDIKPHNILVMNDGKVKVTDFGIARAVSSSTMTYGGDVIGSVHYFSPEQAKGTAITPKTDIYSLGIVMYEMLSGRLPFNGETSVSIALKHLQDTALPLRQVNSNIPPIVEAIVQKAMAKDANERPSSEEMLQDISQALGMIEHKTAGNAIEDPFATRMIPKITPEMEAEAAKSKARTAVSTRPSESKPKHPAGQAADEEEGSFFKTKKFAVAMIVILVFGFFAGAFMSYGKFWSSAELEVPNVVGRQVLIAKQMLEDNNLRVTIAETYDPEVPEGQVVSQYPEAGSMVKEQRTVTIYISKGGEEMVMPDLRGMAQDTALSKMKKMGITVTVIEKSSDEEAGTVLDQDVKAGTKINKGKSVDITVSKGDQKKAINLPDYTGMSIDQARSNIEANKLVVGKVTQKSSSEAPGTVIGQSPAAGGSVKEGSAVDLIISASISKKNASVDDEGGQDARSADTAEAQQAVSKKKGK